MANATRVFIQITSFLERTNICKNKGRFVCKNIISKSSPLLNPDNYFNSTEVQRVSLESRKVKSVGYILV